MSINRWEISSARAFAWQCHFDNNCGPSPGMWDVARRDLLKETLSTLHCETGKLLPDLTTEIHHSGTGVLSKEFGVSGG